MQKNVTGNKFSSHTTQNKQTSKEQGVAEYISLSTYEHITVFEWQKARISLLDSLR